MAIVNSDGSKKLPADAPRLKTKVTNPDPKGAGSTTFIVSGGARWCCCREGPWLPWCGPPAGTRKGSRINQLKGPGRRPGVEQARGCVLKSPVTTRGGVRGLSAPDVHGGAAISAGLAPSPPAPSRLLWMGGPAGRLLPTPHWH